MGWDIREVTGDNLLNAADEELLWDLRAL